MFTCRHRVIWHINSNWRSVHTSRNIHISTFVRQFYKIYRLCYLFVAYCITETEWTVFRRVSRTRLPDARKSADRWRRNGVCLLISQIAPGDDERVNSFNANSRRYPLLARSSCHHVSSLAAGANEASRGEERDFSNLFGKNEPSGEHCGGSAPRHYKHKNARECSVGVEAFGCGRLPSLREISSLSRFDEIAFPPGAWKLQWCAWWVQQNVNSWGVPFLFL